MPNARVTSGELAWRLAPVAVALGSLALGAVALGHRTLTVDEAASAAAAQGSLGTVVSRIVHDDPGQAGELLLLKLAGTVGDSELALTAAVRGRGGACGRALVVLGTLLLERLGGLVAGLAFAVNAGVIEASREARPVRARAARSRAGDAPLRVRARARRRLALDPLCRRRSRSPSPTRSLHRCSQRTVPR